MPALPAAPPTAAPVQYSQEQVRDMILSGGNIGNLTIAQRADYIANLCVELGLNPMLKPFDFIPDGKGGLVLYANKSCTSQLRDIHNISVKKLYSGPLQVGDADVTDVYMVEVEASCVDKDGGIRTQAEVGVSYIGGLKGADLANKLMHTWTKAIRRATLAIKGIGIPDEEELRDTPAFAAAFEKQAKEPRKIVSPKELVEAQPIKTLDKVEARAELKADPVLIGE